MRKEYFNEFTAEVMPGTALDQPNSPEDFERVPWWRQGSAYSEKQRKDRRSIFMHKEWVRHRSSERFARNMKTLPSSGINQALSTELSFVTLISVGVVMANVLLHSVTGFDGIQYPG